MTNATPYPLRLPRSLKAAIEKIAKEEGVSINRFVATAVAEKLAVMNTAEFFAERKNRADLKAFRRIMKRKGGQHLGLAMCGLSLYRQIVARADSGPRCKVIV